MLRDMFPNRAPKVPQFRENIKKFLPHLFTAVLQKLIFLKKKHHEVFDEHTCNACREMDGNAKLHSQVDCRRLT